MYFYVRRRFHAWMLMFSPLEKDRWILKDPTSRGQEFPVEEGIFFMASVPIHIGSCPCKYRQVRFFNDAPPPKKKHMQFKSSWETMGGLHLQNLT